jgi:hypothetical protein
MLHVPLVARHKPMPLEEFISLPVHFNFFPNISVIPKFGPKNLNAVGHTKALQTLSSFDLQNSFHLGKTFFSKGKRVLQTDLSNSYMGSLFTASVNTMKQKCNFQIPNAKEKIFSSENSP